MGIIHSTLQNSTLHYKMQEYACTNTLRTTMLGADYSKPSRRYCCSQIPQLPQQQATRTVQGTSKDRDTAMLIKTLSTDRQSPYSVCCWFVPSHPSRLQNLIDRLPIHSCRGGARVVGRSRGTAPCWSWYTYRNTTIASIVPGRSTRT